MSIQRRSIATCIVLTIITCGIYGIYWFIVITDDVGKASEDNSMSGGIAFLLTLVTCGIYGIYWAYQMGKKLANNKKGVNIADNSIVYLILQIFGLGIINYAIIQNDLNQISDAQTAN